MASMTMLDDFPVEADIVQQLKGALDYNSIRHYSSDLVDKLRGQIFDRAHHPYEWNIVRSQGMRPGSVKNPGPTVAKIEIH